jgi:hypothetical protein
MAEVSSKSLMLDKLDAKIKVVELCRLVRSINQEYSDCLLLSSVADSDKKAALRLALKDILQSRLLHTN